MDTTKRDPSPEGKVTSLKPESLSNTAGTNTSPRRGSPRSTETIPSRLLGREDGDNHHLDTDGFSRWPHNPSISEHRSPFSVRGGKHHDDEKGVQNQNREPRIEVTAEPPRPLSSPRDILHAPIERLAKIVDGNDAYDNGDPYPSRDSRDQAKQREDQFNKSVPTCGHDQAADEKSSHRYKGPMKPSCAGNMTTVDEQRKLDSKIAAPRTTPGASNNDASQSSSDKFPRSAQDVISIGNSISTETTHPSLDSGVIIDFESQGLGNLDHILNPVPYYEWLDTLEFRIAALMCLDSGFRPRILPDPKNSGSHFDQKSLPKGLFSVLERGSRALDDLQSWGFCGRMFSILVEDPIRPNVANAVHISMDDISPIIFSKERAINLVVRILNVEYSEMETIPISLVYRFLEILLPLALVSFSGSHVCRFDKNLWGLYEDEIPVDLGFSFASRQLACLNDFVCGPAWVLGKTASKTLSERFKVSLLVQDLQELWGPVYLVGGTAEEGPIIRTERGFLVPLPRHQQTSNYKERGEVECHWTKKLPGYVCDTDRILLRSTTRVLIGTDPLRSFELTVNLSCKSQICEIQQHIAQQLQFPGACNDYYTLEGYEIPLTGGQYVNAGFVIKHKRNPGKTLKASLLLECLNPETDIRPLLKLHIGLEISACTGSAQRISLWDALRLSQVSEKTSNAENCKHAIADPKCIQTCWKRCPSNRSNSATMSDEDVRRTLVKSIMALQHTGIDPEGNQAYWPFLDTPTNQRISPTSFNKWLDILTDTRDTATFAVVSQR